ncbi:antitoxin [Amycolatopsis sp. NPDC023774]|uniref:antitoxin n=1 Tax=Amycolatopsis sp. NPDC023774 TaxID=3155015 RepID=UPI0033EFF4ED
MGINFDELKNKAAEALRDNSDKIEQGLDKAAGFAKSKTSGHDAQIDGGVEKAKDFLGKLAGNDKPGEGQPHPPQQ